MVFNSLTFLLVFFPALVVLYHLPVVWSARKLVLLLASWVFYAGWNPPFVLLLMFSTLVDFFAARMMEREERQGARRLLMVGSLSVNLGLLGWFKYAGFFSREGARALAALGVEWSPPEVDVVLPVGISFYTFQTLSYTIDVYRRAIPAARSFLDFALYVSFFPQLVAGPIVRAADFLPQLVSPPRLTWRDRGWAAALLVIGLFAKVILADALFAPVADEVYGAAADARFSEAWIGTFAFALQIFFDFSGYSTCAIAVALLLGFSIPDNFRFPYAAVGFSDFWRRWHISLSSWLRDYLYISLGGNRGGRLRTWRNLMATMLLGGLWHGAAWRFVVWGALHGVYLVVERFLSATWLRYTGGAALPAPARFGLALVTFALVCLTWVFFRAQTFTDATTLITTMLGGGAAPPDGDARLLDHVARGRVLAATVVVVATHWALRDLDLERFWARVPWLLRAAAIALMILSLVLNPGDDRAFLYFQF